MHWSLKENWIQVQLKCLQRNNSCHFSLFSTSVLLSTEVTVAMESRHYDYGTSCLGLCSRKLKRLFLTRCGEGMFHAEKAGLGLSHDGGVYPFSQLSLPECQRMERGGVERLGECAFSLDLKGFAICELKGFVL